ncbi:hypothetical protein CSW64_12265 [Caulobacter mirabilis]|uniref:Uncharacterized protein n=1 Tax=Caulobacter mirabilis TaxID=69666 RepID=A0A2D2AYR4_9CAUL|nr:hypothetical protein CSW64_12265 [Caulobacter mirabilis]
MRLQSSFGTAEAFIPTCIVWACGRAMRASVTQLVARQTHGAQIAFRRAFSFGPFNLLLTFGLTLAIGLFFLGAAEAQVRVEDAVAIVGISELVDGGAGFGASDIQRGSRTVAGQR